VTLDLSNLLQAVGLIGFLLMMLVGAAGSIAMVLLILTPFSVFAIRRRMDEQQLVLSRIEKHLAQLAEKDSSGGRPLPPL
jgi:hypothetical protein